MSLGTSLLKPDAVGKRKHKLVDDYPSCGVSPKRISVATDEKREHLRTAATSAAKQVLRVCALSVDSIENSSNLLAQCNADILMLLRKKSECSASWKIESNHELNMIDICDTMRIGLQPSRFSISKYLRFEHTFELLESRVNEALIGEASFRRAATLAYLRTSATSRAAVVELRDTQSGAEYIVCSLDCVDVDANLPVHVVEVCALLNEAQAMMRNGSNSTLLLLVSGYGRSSASSVLDEVVQFGYPTSDAITQLQHVHMQLDPSTPQPVCDQEEPSTSALLPSTLIDTLWHFFQHAVIGLRCVAPSLSANLNTSAMPHRFKLWFASSNAESAHVDAEVAIGTNCDAFSVDLSIDLSAS